jgi:ABC-2 type transport system ATP-binding protein
MNVESASSADSSVIGVPPAEPAPVLRATGLSRAFGRVRAVDGLNVTVRAGEIYGFLGTNGAGKTTTIRLLMGIIKSDAGSLELFGQETRRTSLRQKQRIGYVSQEQTFYAWMSCRALGRFVGGLYPTWDAGEFDRLLRVLELPPERKSSQLSGGMRVKLALALALASRPALLILDEPTSGLDPVARREFLGIIQGQAREHHCTTFFSSHRIDEVERVADRVRIIHNGRMRYEGDLQTLRASVRRVRLVAEQPTALSAREDAAPINLEAVDPRADLETPVGMPAQVHSCDSMPPLPPLPPASTVTFAPPAGFEVLRDQSRDGARTLILNAPPALWESFHHPNSEVSLLSLEDIFIALVGCPAAQI